nr:ABC transporter ATP-binding protein [Lachnospiraceae bacterium]
SFLDIKYKLEFVSIIKKLTKEKNLTVIMSLHELEIAKKISDKIVCVKGDRIDKCGTPDEIFKDEYIRELYDIDDAKMPENIDILKI